jgi:phosphoketolase
MKETTIVEEIEIQCNQATRGGRSVLSKMNSAKRRVLAGVQLPAAGMIYLRANPCCASCLVEHIKQRLWGYWGSSQV